MAVAQTDDRGVVEVFDAPRYSEDHAGADIVTCGACGRSWDDAVVTSWTPAPSARCPFEYDHESQSECPDCEGAGEITGLVEIPGGADTCVRCDGTGLVP